MSDFPALLGASLNRGLRLREWIPQKNGLQDICFWEASPPIHEVRGEYFLYGEPTVPGLWSAIRHCVESGKILVLLPPSSPEERNILVRQLPESPPPAASLVIFSSGSSGQPKAVFHSEKSLMKSAQQLRERFPEESHTYCLLPPWGMAGFIFHLMFPLLAGKSHYFCSENFMFCNESLDGVLFENDIRLLVLNPFLLKTWIRNEKFLWKKKVISLTAPLSSSLRNSFENKSAASLMEVYGLTEAAGPVLCERSSLGSELRLTEAGELQIRGAQLLLGYSQEGVFQKSPDWLSTGDKFSEEQGKFSFLTRLKDIIDREGRKISPLVLEEIFNNMPEIQESLIFEKVVAGQIRIGLLYQRKESCSLTEAELSSCVERWARTSLSLDMRPTWWGETQNIPRLSSGKLDRKFFRNEGA